jgi:hypothetical protein
MPWVAVATAPATETWGSDARLARARPLALEHLGELAVPQARGEADRPGVAVDGDIGGQTLQADQLVGVGQVGDRRAGGGRLQLGRGKPAAIAARTRPWPGLAAATRETLWS